MSEMTLFSKAGNSLPAHLQNLQLDATTKALMGSSGTGGRRISIRGNVFRMMVDGKEIAQNEERAMNIIIAAANTNVSRTFYEGTYQEGQATAPSCWSNDGISPDIKSDAPQASKCASCPQNIAGSATQGSGRACRFSQRLAVVLENDIRGDIYQLTLPAQSIFGAAENGKMPLQTYAKFLGSHGLPITAVVTEMRFDTASATPRLTFKAVRPLEADELETVTEKGQSPEAKAAIASTAAQADGVTKMAARIAAAPVVVDDTGTTMTPEMAHAITSGRKEQRKVEAESVEGSEEPTKRAKKAAPKDVADILDDWAE
jgi:hypothetical protein